MPKPNGPGRSRRAEAAGPGSGRDIPGPGGEPEGGEAGEPGERLQRTLARAGFGSRRAAEDLIRDGRVLVNGTVAELGRRVDPRRDSITVDGVPIPVHPELRYHALNKPRGVTTTLQDPHAESSLVPYLPPGPRLFPVGRLDRESEGLLLFTV